MILFVIYIKSYKIDSSFLNYNSEYLDRSKIPFVKRLYEQSATILFFTYNIPKRTFYFKVNINK